MHVFLVITALENRNHPFRKTEDDSKARVILKYICHTFWDKVHNRTAVPGQVIKKSLLGSFHFDQSREKQTTYLQFAWGKTNCICSLLSPDSSPKLGG